jgi:hypothetical protein
VLQQLSSHAYTIKSQYKFNKQKDNVKRNRTANMQIRPSGNVGIVALQTAEESGQ